MCICCADWFFFLFTLILFQLNAARLGDPNRILRKIREHYFLWSLTRGKRDHRF